LSENIQEALIASKLTTSVRVAEQHALALTLFGVCLFGAYLLPFHFLPFPQFYNDWLAAFGLACMLAGYAKTKGHVLHLPWIALAPVGIATLIALQAASGMLTEGADAFLPIFSLLLVALAIVLGASISSTKQGTFALNQTLAAVFLLAGLVSVAIASLQLFAADELLFPLTMGMARDAGAPMRPYANLGQPNQLALILCFAIAAVWWFYQVDKLNGFVSGWAIVSLLWGLVLTQSRIGWIIIPAFALCVVSYGWRQGMRKIPYKYVLFFVLVYLSGIIFYSDLARAVGAFNMSPIERMSGSSDRLAMVRQAWEISTTFPWFGAGWGEFGPEQIRIALDFPPTVYSSHAHNIIFNFAAELGWPITILFLATICYWFYVNCLRKNVDTEVAFGTLIFLAVSVHSLVEFPLWYVYVLIPVALLIGMIHSRQAVDMPIMAKGSASTVLAIVVLAGVLGVAMDYRRLASSMWTAGLASEGIKVDIWNFEKPKLTLFPHFYNYFQAKTIVPREGMPSSEIKMMEKVSQRFGYRYELHQLALAYALNADQDKAVTTLQRFRHLHLDYYKMVYEEWQRKAKRNPALFSKIIERLPVPE